MQVNIVDVQIPLVEINRINKYDQKIDQKEV